jgi:hypothetical protein
MLSLLKKNHYEVCNYETYQSTNRCVILRHDVDFSLEAALRFAELEGKEGIQSTYFILLSTPFYNPFYRKSRNIINSIRDMGHDIGLHFDEANYLISNKEELINHVEREIAMLSKGLNLEIKAVSMHRPSKWVLEENVQFKSVINSYSSVFFDDFKYLSDSRMHWREDVCQVIQSSIYDRLHILTHPIWYGQKERTMKEILLELIMEQKSKCYEDVRENIRDLDKVLLKSDL